MAVHLRRVSDGKGDSGAMSQSISWNEDGTFKEIVDTKPVVGCSVRVGAITARSYSAQDWWMTTEVIEILEESNTEDYFYSRFKTKNSIYEFWTGDVPKELFANKESWL